MAEAELCTALLSLGRALLSLGRALLSLFLARSAARLRPVTYEHDGERYALDTSTQRRSEIGTRFGKTTFSDGIGRPWSNRSAGRS